MSLSNGSIFSPRCSTLSHTRSLSVHSSSVYLVACLNSGCYEHERDLHESTRICPRSSAKSSSSVQIFSLSLCLCLSFPVLAIPLYHSEEGHTNLRFLGYRLTMHGRALKDVTLWVCLSLLSFFFDASVPTESYYHQNEGVVLLQDDDYVVAGDTG